MIRTSRKSTTYEKWTRSYRLPIAPPRISPSAIPVSETTRPMRQIIPSTRSDRDDRKCDQRIPDHGWRESDSANNENAAPVLKTCEMPEDAGDDGDEIAAADMLVDPVLGQAVEQYDYGCKGQEKRAEITLSARRAGHQAAGSGDDHGAKVGSRSLQGLQRSRVSRR